MDRFEWQDYTCEYASLVASWLTADDVRMTGPDESFDVFCRYWEISDVRAAKEYRDRGCATTISVFVAEEVIKNGRIPTVCTENTNAPMLKVIGKLRFRPFDEDEEKTRIDI